MALSWSLDKLGPMARSAADCEAILKAIGGHDPEDPSQQSRATATRAALPRTVRGAR